jgi:MFS superfamily sulfate permease-like transporter/CRP-like cAMP-binding protein
LPDRNDLSGGLVSAAVAMPLAAGYGMFAFAPLGNEYFAYGALAGLYTAIVAGVVCVTLGDRTTTVYAPRITTTFFLGALLYGLTDAGPDVLSGRPDLVFIAFFSIVLVGGAFQALFGLFRIGSMLRFTPRPVMAGLQNAAAALLFLVQLQNVCGFDHRMPFTALPMHLAEVKPLSVVVAAVTFLAMWNARAFTARVPPLLFGLGIGIALHFLLVAAGLGAQLGPGIGIPGPVVSPSPIHHLSSLSSADAVYDLLPTVLAGGLALAVVAAFDALLCSRLVTPPGTARIDGDRLLARLGIANIASACCGGITSGINIGPTVANRQFGASTSLSVLTNAAALLAVVVALFPLVSYMPRAVLSAAIMVIAVQHIDLWSIDLVRRLRSGATRNRVLMLLDLAVVAIVAILAVTINIVLAVFIGLAAAAALFVARMSRLNVRRSYRGDTVHSRKVRMPAEAAQLETRGSDILVLELQGVLFFGSAEKLREHIEGVAISGTRTIILDLRRVTEIDATGARTLADIQLSLAHEGRHLAFAVQADSDLAMRLAETGVVDAVGTDRVFADADRAIEWAEDELLRGGPAATEEGELPVSSLDLCSGLTPAEVADFEGHLERRSYSSGTVIFREGDAGSELFIVAKGHASACLSHPSGGDIRLATFAPGTVFGELAILDAGVRSASVRAEDDVACYVLGKEEFSALVGNSPSIAIKVLTNLGSELSVRLRRANLTIHQLGD